MRAKNPEENVSMRPCVQEMLRGFKLWPLQPAIPVSVGDVIIMGRYAHKTKTQRKLITIQEWADRMHVSRPKIYNYLKRYQKKGYDYDPRDINSVLDFHRYIVLSSLL